MKLPIILLMLVSIITFPIFMFATFTIYQYVAAGILILVLFYMVVSGWSYLIRSQ